MVLASAIRVALVALGWPHLNSDEGTMGLMARHIAYGGEHPIFFYSQSYMGTTEAYMGAILFHLFGASTFSLRLGQVLLFATFLASLYLLTGKLYDKRLALLMIALLSLGSERMLFRQVQAIGGYTETLVFGSLLLVLTLRLALAAGQDARPTGTFLGWGLVAGLGLWSDLLIAPFVLIAGAELFAFCRRELFQRSGLLLLLGMLAGTSPLLAYDISAAQSHNAASTFLATYRTGGSVSIPENIAGTVLVSLPAATAGSAICPLRPEETWPIWHISGSGVIRCTMMHGLWGVGIIVLWTLAGVTGAHAWWSMRRRSRDTGCEGSRGEQVLASCRLGLLGTAGLTVLLYVLSSASGESPWFNARYLTGLWVALPAILAPLLAQGRARSQTIGGMRSSGVAVIVQRDPHTAYAFPLGSPQAEALVRRVSRSHQQYYRFVDNGYVVDQLSGGAVRRMTSALSTSSRRRETARLCQIGREHAV